MSEFWNALGIVFVITIYAVSLYAWGYRDGERDAKKEST
jgi:hypothetical protein